MDYKHYQTARDFAWRILLQCNIRKLPVKVSYICKQNGYKLYSYTEGNSHIREFHLEDQCARSDGFSTRFDDCYYIFYNPHMLVGRIRFTIAHEIGHILLGHLNKQGAFTSQNREPGPSDAPEEQMANVFASRLLAPACVLHDLNVTTPEQIAALCDISLQSATYRAERLGILKHRKQFGISPLEREVYQRFLPFLNSLKKA